ncbi:transporter [Xanthomonas campestris pv. campestris]|nr:transporter [Xanthomonas campestris pv. campestris]
MHESKPCEMAGPACVPAAGVRWPDEHVLPKRLDAAVAKRERQSGRAQRARGRVSLLRNAVSICTAVPLAAMAENVSLGSYIPAPPGTHLGLLYAANGRATTYVPGSGPSIRDGTELSTTSGIARYLYFLDAGGTRVQLQAGLPFMSQEVELGGARVGVDSGFMDPFVGVSVWPVNDTTKGEYLGITAIAYVPLGSYHHDSAVNVAANRYHGVLQAGYSRVLGRWQFDLVGDVTVYGDNDDSGPERATLSQENRYSLQPWMGYRFTEKLTGSVGAINAWGGRIHVDGVDTDRRTRSLRGRLGLAYWVAPRFQVYAELTRDISVESGYKFDHSGFIRLGYIF